MLVARAALCLALAACCAAWASHAPGVGGLELDRFGPLVRSLNDQGVPDDVEGVRVAAWLLDVAHDPGAAGLYRYAERQALLDLLGQPRPPKPGNIELAAMSMHGEEGAIAALRARLLEAPVRAEVLRERDPTVEPRLHGQAFRHEAASMWVQDSGGRYRVLGVRVENAIPRPIARGAFTMAFGSGRGSLAFTCAYGELAVGASQAVACSGDGTRSADAVLRVLGGEGEAELRHREVAFALPGGRFEVRRDQAHFVDDDRFVERRALAMLDESSCRARGTCAKEAREEMAGRPTLLGFVLGLVAAGVYAVVLLVRGSRSAGKAATAMSVVMGLVLFAGVAAAVAGIRQGPGFYVLLVGGMALGHAGDLLLGFLVALGASIAAIEFVRGRYAGR